MPNKYKIIYNEAKVTHTKVIRTIRADSPEEAIGKIVIEYYINDVIVSTMGVTDLQPYVHNIISIEAI